MKKALYALLFLTSIAFAKGDDNLSREDKQGCKIVEEALRRAHINFRFNQGDDFGKPASETSVDADVPASFTTQKANACACCTYFLPDKPKIGEMVTVIASGKDERGAILINFEQADFKELAESNDLSIQSRYEIIEDILLFYHPEL